MINNQFFEKSLGVFHAKSWNSIISQTEIEELFLLAEASGNKARLCLHPDSNEIVQITYLAFIRPYVDKVHCHPFRNETIHVIDGKVRHNIYSDLGNLVKSLELSKSNNISISKIGRAHV